MALEKDDIIQINPRHKWGPALAFVDEVKELGCRAGVYVVHNDGKPAQVAYINIADVDFERVGAKCIFVRNDTPEPQPGYEEPIPEYGHVMTMEEFRESVRLGMFIDYDGSGYPAKDGKMMRKYIRPSDLDQIPEDATHVVWFNK